MSEAAYRLERVHIPLGLDVECVMAEVRQGRHPGYVDMRPLRPSDFTATVPRPDVDYDLVDVDLGHDLLDVAPAQARLAIEAAGRSPLTLDEGVAIVLAHPGILRAANCFQMLGSSAGDRRVPSLWVTSQGRVRLGWCWEGMPHTWLGAASCARRERTVAHGVWAESG